ncbi:hypothetical protein N825_06380 [Skermanella stibiiresistens SB22]|uniref:Lipoprotein n=1 Tax=Skermanella stibiiresistens SB22 TaxID=1385369 RepID=W9H6D8_9PROT|nr:hypothetical protein [Skermanella stibiiresistens]EWY39328.1 hypothetical protein N825_06380 [Skermanella stibiiresistens SB22]
MRLISFGPAAMAVLLLSGCASFGGSAGDVGAGKLTWFSYVNGEDLRAQCSADGPDRYRLIHNAKPLGQLRTYEVHGQGDGEGGQGGSGGAVVEAREIAAADLSRQHPEDALEGGGSGPSRLILSAEQFQWLIRGLSDSGVFDAPLDGFHLRSDGVFWLASGCHDGAYFLTAFSNPSERFESIGGRLTR